MTMLRKPASFRCCYCCCSHSPFALVLSLNFIALHVYMSLDFILWGHSDIEARLDRELAAEIAGRAQVVGMVGSANGNFGEGDESEYGGGRSEGSWSFARCGAPLPEPSTVFRPLRLTMRSPCIFSSPSTHPHLLRSRRIVILGL